MTAQDTKTYRRDIDGLRAIAVLSVIVFHLKETLLPGGYIGVDIFFVISGYLISNQIFSAVESGNFSILDFYRRRVKRIVPAMLLVVVVTLLISQSILRPQDAERAAESALASLLSLANVYFWAFQDTSYFAAASNELPLLHLWSLGVEEQFYLIWPLVILIAATTSAKRPFLVGMVAVAATSFIAGEYFFSWSPSFVYYMLPTRAGELLLGCILAHPISKARCHRFSQQTNNILAVTGLVLIFGSLFTLSEADVFPGLRALPPTLGAALLIASGMSTQTLVSRGLSAKPMVFVGLISYSAYLWHWPLIAFMNYGYGEISPAVAVVIFALTFLLAWLTYVYVETPLRYTQGSAYSIIVKQYIVPAGILSLICLICMKIDGYGYRYVVGDYKQSLLDVREATKPATKYDYVCQRDVLTKKDLEDDGCIVGPRKHQKPTVLLWGDSNAAHYVGILGAIAEHYEFPIRNLEVGACPPLLSNVESYSIPTRVADCVASSDNSRLAFDQHSTIIIGGSYTKYIAESHDFLESFAAMVSELSSEGKKIVLLGKIPVIPSHDRFCREKSLSMPFLHCEVVDVPLSEDILKVNQFLERFAQNTNNVWYFDVTKFLCPNGTCSAFDKQERLIYFDSSHLTLEASWRLGREIVAIDMVPSFFDKIARKQ